MGYLPESPLFCYVIFVAGISKRQSLHAPVRMHYINYLAARSMKGFGDKSYHVCQ